MNAKHIVGATVLVLFFLLTLFVTSNTFGLALAHYVLDNYNNTTALVWSKYSSVVMPNITLKKVINSKIESQELFQKETNDPNIIKDLNIEVPGKPLLKRVESEVIVLKKNESMVAKNTLAITDHVLDAGISKRIIHGSASEEEVNYKVSEILRENSNLQLEIKNLHLFTGTKKVDSVDSNHVIIGVAEIIFPHCNYFISLHVQYNFLSREYNFLDNTKDWNCEARRKSNDFEQVELLTCKDCVLAPVGKQRRLPETYIPIIRNDKSFGDTFEIDVRAYNDFVDLYNAAVRAGHNMNVTSSYRSYETQEETFNTWVQSELRADSITIAEAKERANTYSAKPGFSEHQLGTTIDLNASECLAFVGICQQNEALWFWLSNNAWRYGFVLSYPQDKQQETGYIFEPWHYRWIGKAAAAEFQNIKSFSTLEAWFQSLRDNERF